MLIFYDGKIPYRKGRECIYLSLSGAKFIDGRSLNVNGDNSVDLCESLVIEYNKEVEPDEMIRTLIHVRLTFIFC